MAPFERFYTKTAEIVSITEEGAYSRKEVITPICTVKADIQPYISGEASRNELGDMQFGLSEQYKLKLFSAPNEHIEVGNYVRYKDKYYRIEHVSDWETGAEAILAERGRGG